MESERKNEHHSDPNTHLHQPAHYWGDEAEKDKEPPHPPPVLLLSDTPQKKEAFPDSQTEGGRGGAGGRGGGTATH